MTCLSQFWHLTMSHDNIMSQWVLTMSHDNNTMSLSSDTWHPCVRLSQSDCRTSVGRWPIFRLLSCRLQQTKINSYLKYSLSLEIKRSIATRSLRGPLSTPEVLCCSSSTFISRTNDDDSRWTVTHLRTRQCSPSCVTSCLVVGLHLWTSLLHLLPPQHQRLTLLLLSHTIHTQAKLAIGKYTKVC